MNTDFVWPSDAARAESDELDRVCEELEAAFDELEANRAGSPAAAQLVNKIASLYSGEAVQNDPTELTITGDTVWLAQQARRELSELLAQGADPVEYICHYCGNPAQPPAPFTMYVKCPCGATTPATIAADLAQQNTQPQSAQGAEPVAGDVTTEFNRYKRAVITGAKRDKVEVDKTFSFADFHAGYRAGRWSPDRPVAQPQSAGVPEGWEVYKNRVYGYVVLKKVSEDWSMRFPGETDDTEMAFVGEFLEALLSTNTTSPEPRPLPNNRFGVDRDYFTKKLEIIIRDMRDYIPAELARSLARLAAVADGEVLQEAEFNTTSPDTNPEACYWHGDDSGCWKGSCGIEWYFEDGGPDENGVNHCPRCGRARVNEEQEGER